MIITTSVKFFESFVCRQAGDCRKLHSIANSVIVFDEAQSLPTELAPATVKAVNALCKRYNCSMVFSTATQPSFDALPDTEWKPVEIIPENKNSTIRCGVFMLNGGFAKMRNDIIIEHR